MIQEKIWREYQRKKKRESIIILITQLLIVTILIAAWEIAGRNQWIDTLLFSYPGKVIALIVERFAEGTLLSHIGITVLETIFGFLLGTLFGTALATLIWWSSFLSRTLDPFLVVLNSMPKVALGPLIIVGFGPNIGSVIVMALAVTVIITTIVIYTRFREVDPNYIKIVRIFGGSRRDVFLKVILPASFPTIVSTLKVNVGLSWVGVIVGEFLVAKQGLGYLIIYGFQVFNFTLVIASLFLIAIVATFMYQGVAYLENKLTKGQQ